MIKIYEKVMPINVKVTETENHWILHNVPLLSEFSQNKGLNNPRRYTKEEQERAVSTLEHKDMMPIYCNHGEKKDVLEKLGMATNPHVVVKNIDGKQVAETVGDVHLVKGEKGNHIARLAKLDGRLAGMSITGDAEGGFKESNGYDEIQGLKLNTVDVVDRPATTRGFVECLNESIQDEGERTELLRKYIGVKEHSQGEDPNQPNQDIPTQKSGGPAAAPKPAAPEAPGAPNKAKPADVKLAKQPENDIKSEPIDSTKWIGDCDKCGGDVIDGECEDCGTETNVNGHPAAESVDVVETFGTEDNEPSDDNPPDNEQSAEGDENEPEAENEMDPEAEDTDPANTDDPASEDAPDANVAGNSEDPLEADGMVDPGLSGGQDLEQVRDNANAATASAESANTSQAHMDAMFKHMGAAATFAEMADPNGARLHADKAEEHKEKANQLRDQEGDQDAPPQPPMNNGNDQNAPISPAQESHVKTKGKLKEILQVPPINKTHEDKLRKAGKLQEACLKEGNKNQFPSRSKKFPVGQKVRVTMGTQTGKTGTVIHHSEMPYEKRKSEYNSGRDLSNKHAVAFDHDGSKEFYADVHIAPHTKESAPPAKPTVVKLTTEELVMLKITPNSKLAEGIVTLAPEARQELMDRLYPPVMPSGGRRVDESLFPSQPIKPEAKSQVSEAFPKPVTGSKA